MEFKDLQSEKYKREPLNDKLKDHFCKFFCNIGKSHIVLKVETTLNTLLSKLLEKNTTMIKLGAKNKP